MDRPEIRVDNPAVYEYYSNLPANPEFMQKFHRLSAFITHTQRLWLPGSREAIGQHLGDGLPVLALLGHATWLDPVFQAGAIYEESELNPIIGNVVTPANAPYFEKPFFGWLFDKGRAVPAFRTKDVHGESGIITFAELEEAREIARRELAKLCIGAVDNRSSVAIFAEEHRNTGNRKKVQVIKHTPVKITRGVRDQDELMVIAMMPYYGNKRFKNLFRATMAVGHIDPSLTSQLRSSDLQDLQQTTLDLAVAAYESRTHKGLLG